MRIPFLFTLAISPAILMANPTGPTVIHGDVRMAENGSILEIQAGDRSIINWEGFSIQLGELTSFIQPNQQAVVLNRVMSEFPSSILGDLKANGQILLLNPNGILVGAGALIDTGAFLGSTFDLSDDAFMEGKELGFEGNSNQSIVNLGTIRANHGDIYLMAFQIDNKGLVSAQNGIVGLATGKSILLKPKEGKFFVRAAIDNEVDGEIGVLNQGQIKALQTQIQADGTLYSVAIKCEGEIDALGTVEKEGRVYLIAEEGKVIVNGKVSALNQTQSGGEIRVLGKEVGLFDEAMLDVSSPYRGGTVLVGGDFQGENPNIYSADRVFVGPDASIHADTLAEGAPGKIIVWSREGTHFLGRATAQGGLIGGDGGFIEISGKDFLDFSGTVNTMSLHGKTGTLLLDPTNLTITGADSNVTGATPFTPTGQPSTLSNITLGTAWTASNVVVQTTGTTFAVNEPGTIFVNATVTPVPLAATANSITFTTQVAGVSAGDIIVNALIHNPAGGTGAINLFGQRDVTINNQVIADGGALTVRTLTGDVTINGANLVTAGYSGAGLFTNNGSITVSPVAGDVSLLGGTGAMEQALIEATAAGPIVVQTAGDLILRGLGAPGISDAGTSIQSASTVTLTVGGDLLAGLQAGEPINTLYSPNEIVSGTTLTMNITGDARFVGDAGQSAAADLIVAGTLDLTTGGDLLLIAGNGTITTTSPTVQMTATPMNLHIGGDLVLSASAVNPAGAFITSGGTITADVGGSVSLSTPLVAQAIIGGGATAINLTAGGNITLVSNLMFSPGSDIAASVNMSVQAGGSILLTGGPSFIGFPSGANANPLFVSAGGNITLNDTSLIGQRGVGFGQHPVNVTAGGSVSLTDTARISGRGPTVVTSSRDVSLADASFIQAGTDVTVNAGRDVFMSGTSFITNLGFNAPNTTTLFAGHSLTMTDQSSITSPTGETLIVLDNSFPTSPGVGTGALNLGPQAFINSDLLDGFALRIFTARQILNQIQGLLNGFAFVAGIEPFDSATEKWSTYFPSTYGGFPFTIFYKGFNFANPEAPFVAIAEMLRDLHPYGEYIMGGFHFSVAYLPENGMMTHWYFLPERAHKVYYRYMGVTQF